jgi:hypothetical protein
MSIEAWDIDLHSSKELIAQSKKWAKEDLKVIPLSTSVRAWKETRAALLELRALGYSALVHLKEGEENSESFEVLEELCAWDQLSLRNVLVLMRKKIPESFFESLRLEAKIEEKWFSEWNQALQDPRLHKYPGLPWRRFIRKANRENLDFAKKIEAVSGGDCENAVTEFLLLKKKAVNIFPKKWSANK